VRPDTHAASFSFIAVPEALVHAEVDRFVAHEIYVASGFVIVSFVLSSML
jgi:hypothetical protein